MKKKEKKKKEMMCGQFNEMVSSNIFFISNEVFQQNWIQWNNFGGQIDSVCFRFVLYWIWICWFPIESKIL